MSLETAESFADFTNTPGSRVEEQLSIDSASYDRMREDTILDEETVHWKVLATRLFCFFLLFLVILCCILEFLSWKLLVLAAFICAFLIFVIIGTYVDLQPYLLATYNTLLCRTCGTAVRQRNDTAGSADSGMNATVSNPIPSLGNRL